jgi:small subunit ribosomal protein S20
MLKRVARAIESNNREEARAAYESAVPILDRMARRGIIHRNKAARHKKRLALRIRALA